MDNPKGKSKIVIRKILLKLAIGVSGVAKTLICCKSLTIPILQIFAEL